MTNKIRALVGAALVALATVGPGVAAADPPRRYHEDHRDDRRDHYDRGRYDGRYDDRHRYHRDHYDDDDDNDDALAAGILGLIIGAVAVAALTGSDTQNRSEGDYGYAQAPPPAYGYGDPYQARTCVVREPQYDPYVGRTLMIEKRVPC